MNNVYDLVQQNLAQLNVIFLQTQSNVGIVSFTENKL
jgi:hypothetical protein